MKGPAPGGVLTLGGRGSPSLAGERMPGRGPARTPRAGRMPGTGTDAVRAVVAARLGAGRGHGLTTLAAGGGHGGGRGLTTLAGGLGQRAGNVWQHALATQPLPPRWLILGSAVLALAAVASPRLWPVARNVVTIVHEGGHALTALATGRHLSGVRLYRSTAGETVSSGRSHSPGIALTAAAGYPAPSLLGLGAAALLTIGHLTAMLLLSLVLLAGLAIAIRNVYGMLAVLVTAGAIAGVCLFASPAVQAAFGYTMTWFLLLGGVRPVIELQAARRGPALRRRPARPADPAAGRRLGHDLRPGRRGRARAQRPLARLLTGRL